MNYRILIASSHLFMSFPSSATISLIVCGALSACGVMDATTRVTRQVTDRVTQSIKPYRITVVQGNVVTKEQFEALRSGMSRLQLRDILGTPLLTSVFHADRWDYVFTYQRQGAPSQSRRVTLYFKNDLLDRFEANEELPSEGEFAGLIEGNQKPNKAPVLELSSDRLSKLITVKKEPAPETSDGQSSLPANYPPLETPGR
jgi:outer membrane protein assembly factor BamE